MPKDSSTHRLSLPPPQILASAGTPSTSFYIVNLFLNCPPALTSNLFPSMFANFFWNKVLKLYSIIKSNSTNTSPHFQPRHIPLKLTVFTPVSREELSKLISQSSNTFCDLDPIPCHAKVEVCYIMLLNWRIVRSALLILISTFAFNRSHESVVNRKFGV